MESAESTYFFSNAVIDLQNAGFQVESKAYGFSVVLQDAKTNYYVECGLEHDGNVSISVNTGKPPVMWFMCPTIQGMVELLVMAGELMKSRQADDWIVALNKINPIVKL